MLLRVLATLGFAYIAFQTYSFDKELLGIKYFLIFGAAAVLYNPILPIYLPREIWTIINVATAFLVFQHWQVSKQGNFKTEKNNQTLAKPCSPLERSYSINYDKDVTRPLQLQKSNFRESLYSESYDRIVSLWTLGYVHGFMAYANFLDVYVDHEEALELVQPFADTILKNVFSEKEFADFKSLNHDQLHQSAEWEDGFEWGLRNCESWQEHGEVTLIWSDYISGERDSIFTFDKPSKAEWPVYEEEEDILEKADTDEEELSLGKPSEPDLQVKTTEEKYVKDLKTYFLRAFGAIKISEIPRDFNQNEYVAGFAIGFFSIVLDGLKGGLNWSTEEKGSYGMVFFTELFNDENSVNIKCLKDKEYAIHINQQSKFSEGREHGSLLAAAHYELLKADLSEPLIDACRNLSNSTAGVDMQTAVFTLTLQQYVLSEWPNSISGSN